MQTYQKTQPNPKADKQICEAGMQTDRHANKSQNTKSKSKNKQLDLLGHKMVGSNCVIKTLFYSA